MAITTHGEPDAWKFARPVRREGRRNLPRKRGKALHPYSTKKTTQNKIGRRVLLNWLF